MDCKFLLFVLVALTLTLFQQIEAAFFWDHESPKLEDIEKLGLECVPGRTVFKISSKEQVVEEVDDDYEEDVRRTHMNYPPKDEVCKICVCSAEGKDEYCSQRPAKNVNECILLSKITEQINKAIPYDHQRSLAYRIRRDYLWHGDELPYDPTSKCRRGYSYYTNYRKANDTDLKSIPSDLESYLDYKETRDDGEPSCEKTCLFCICHTHGRDIRCIKRQPWVCDYYRYLRHPDSSRDMYTKLFQQDRPGYFRQISYRLRRTMDDNLYELIENGGDSLCCNHPDGHRRSLHRHIKNKVRMFKKKSVKENLMSKKAAGDYDDFVVNNDK